MSPKYRALLIVISLSFCLSLVSGSDDDFKNYRMSPKMMAVFKITHPDDPVLHKLDMSMAKISTIYMQALFSGTHSPELDMDMRKLEMELFDQLESLYKQDRLKDYMRYEAEITRQMIIYNMLKKLFGYGVEDEGKTQ